MLVLEQDPVPPRMLNPKADRDLEMICLRCLQKPQDLRYASAAALADDLEAYLNDESISARSGRFGQILAGLMRETHHAAVLENWGLLWMWHSLALLVACFATNTLDLSGDDNRWHYFLLWTAGLGTWAAVFWALAAADGAGHVRRAADRPPLGRLDDLHRAACSRSKLGSICPSLTLSPVLGLVTGMVFLAKAGILSGEFYIWAAHAVSHRRSDGALSPLCPLHLRHRQRPAAFSFPD